MRFRVLTAFFVLLLPGVLLAGPGGKSCSCSGSDKNGNSCSCNCTGIGCVCGCSVGDGCICKMENPEVLSLREGTTVGSAASTVSRVIRREVVVRAGADEVIPHEISNSTGWQILARLSRLPGVRLTVKQSNILGEPGSILAEGEQGIAAFPPTHVLTVCSVGATLAAVLDAISERTGVAFDVVGDLSTRVDGQAKGTVEQVIEQLSSGTGATVALATE